MLLDHYGDEYDDIPAHSRHCLGIMVASTFPFYAQRHQRGWRHQSSSFAWFHASLDECHPKIHILLTGRRYRVALFRYHWVRGWVVDRSLRELKGWKTIGTVCDPPRVSTLRHLHLSHAPLPAAGTPGCLGSAQWVFVWRCLAAPLSCTLPSPIKELR